MTTPAKVNEAGGPSTRIRTTALNKTRRISRSREPTVSAKPNKFQQTELTNL